MPRKIAAYCELTKFSEIFFYSLSQYPDFKATLRSILQHLSKNLINWLLFTVLSFLWGSSFILMKLSLQAYSAWQVASLRMVSAGIVLLPFAIKFFRLIPKDKLPVVFISGALGSLVPAYLFCLAEVGISSTLAGMLNSLTPIFVIIIGALFFNTRTTLNKILGIITAFTGSVLLLLSKGVSGQQDIFYVAFVIVATICYGINGNMVNRYLKGIPSLHIAAVALVLNAIPALGVLFFTGFFTALPATAAPALKALGAATVLGIGGTAIATILFYQLIKSAGPVFSAMVTYGIPVVAIMWGIVFNEPVGWKQVGCLLLILSGVFIANIDMIVTAAKNRMTKQ
jgi:drug/metabolite transporter (DMT)-like permease